MKIRMGVEARGGVGRKGLGLVEATGELAERNSMVCRRFLPRILRTRSSNSTLETEAQLGFEMLCAEALFRPFSTTCLLVRSQFIYCFHFPTLARLTKVWSKTRYAQI